jgi:hypothetical protein
MKENLSVYPGVHGTHEVVDIAEYSRTTRSCHKKLEVRYFRTHRWQVPVYVLFDMLAR